MTPSLALDLMRNAILVALTTAAPLLVTALLVGILVSLATDAMGIALKVALPLLLVGLVVGLIVSIVQAVTQIQEQTLSFIPQILAMAAVLGVGGPWMLNQLLSYTAELWQSIPNMVG